MATSVGLATSASASSVLAANSGESPQLALALLLFIVGPFVLIALRRPLQRSVNRRLQGRRVSDFQQLAGGWSLRVGLPPEQAVTKAAAGLSPWKSGRGSQKVSQTAPGELSIEVGNAAYRWLECQLAAGADQDGTTLVRFSVPRWREQAGVPVAGEHLQRISAELRQALGGG